MKVEVFSEEEDRNDLCNEPFPYLIISDKGRVFLRIDDHRSVLLHGGSDHSSDLPSIYNFNSSAFILSSPSAWRIMRPDEHITLRNEKKGS